MDRCPSHQAAFHVKEGTPVLEQTLFPVDEAADTSLRLRPPQIECRDAVVDSLSENPSCIAIMATGTGKTEVAASVIHALDPGLEGTVVCSPFRDLVAQTADRLRKRGVPNTIEMATLRSSTPVTVGCYASLLSRDRYQQFLGRKLLIVDESHINYTKNAVRMITHFRESGTKVLGLTATPDRMQGDPLTKFYGPVAFDYPYRSALRDGWLVPTKVWMAVIEEMDLTQCQGTKHEFNLDRLNEIMAKERVVHAIASLVAQHYDGLPSVVFCANIRQAEMLREVLERHRVMASIVHSNMDPEERRMHLRDFENGDSEVIINVGCLTMGWDHPPVRKLFLARPTKSRALYQQMFGRGTRPLPGVVDGWGLADQRRQAIADSAKPCCEIFDITDTTRHNDLRSAIDVYAPEIGPALMRRVRSRVERNQTAGSDIDAVVAAEKAALAAEEAARWALEAGKRSGIKVDARFGIYERDVFAEAELPDIKRQRGWRMLFGKHKGWPLRDVPLDYLRWVIRDSNCRNKAFVDAVRTEVQRRMATKR